MISCDVVESLVPKQHKKLVTHIHKMLTKQKKKKEQKVSKKYCHIDVSLLLWQQDSKIHKLR